MGFRVLGTFTIILLLISTACQNQGGSGDGDLEAIVEYQQSNGENAGLETAGTSENEDHQEITPSTEGSPGGSGSAGGQTVTQIDSDDILQAKPTTGDDEYAKPGLNPGFKMAVQHQAIVGLGKKMTAEEYCTEIYNQCEAQTTNISQKGQCADNYDKCKEFGNCDTVTALCNKNGGSFQTCNHEGDVCTLTNSCRDKRDDCMATAQSVPLCNDQYEGCKASIEAHIVPCAESKQKCFNMGGGSGECNGFYETCMKNI